jgi:hypothetical protein
MGSILKKARGVSARWAKCPGQQIRTSLLVAVAARVLEEGVAVHGQKAWGQDVEDINARACAPLIAFRAHNCGAKDHRLRESRLGNAPDGLASPLRCEKRVPTLATEGFLLAAKSRMASSTGDLPIRH